MTASVHGSYRHARPATHPRIRRVVAGAAGGALALGMVVAVPGTAYAFGTNSFGGSLLRGSAHGGNGQLANGTGSILKLGPIAKQSLGCNPIPGVEIDQSQDDVTSQLNFLGSVTLPVPQSAPALTAKQLRNTGYVTASDTEANVYEKATSSAINLLNGVITATTLQETAHTRFDANGYFNEADSVFQDLYVDPDGSGPQEPVAIPHPSPNQTIDLGPIGSVVLNEQIPNATGITANAIHLHVGDYAGFHGDLYVAHVETLASKAPARISGFAYSSQAQVKPILASGKQYLANLPCAGTAGKDKVVTGARLILPGSSAMPTLVDEGTLKNTVNAKLSATSPYSHSTSRIETLKALVDANHVPVLSADVIQTDAWTSGGYDQYSYQSTGVKTPITGLQNDGSMSVLNLVVNGNPVADGQVPPNTAIDLPGLGTLTLNEQRCSTGPNTTTDCSAIGPVDTHYLAITVIGVHIVVTVSDNSAGLPVGADIKLAVSHSDLAF